MDDSDRQITEDEAARRAAEIAAELSETGAPQDRRRVAKALALVARSAARTAWRGAGLAHLGGRETAPDESARDAVPGGGEVVPGGGEVVPRDGPESGLRRGPKVTSIALRGTRVVRRGAGMAAQTIGIAAQTFASVVTWLTGQVMEMAPRLKIRDTKTLHAKFPDKTDDEIAEQLIGNAMRASAAVGGATGMWAVLPTLPTFPAEIAAETLAITGIEIKLVAELHEVYGMGVTGTVSERGRAYIASWAHRRGVYMVPGGLLLVGGSPLAGQVRRRLAARVRRSTFSLAPLFTGAVAGAMINSRETKKLGDQILDDLRRQRLTQLSRLSRYKPYGRG
jgi:hypothetical protein